MAPPAQPIVSIDEIDEALWWVILTAPRDRHYPRIIDALLDQRNSLVSPDPRDQAAPPPGSQHQHEDRPASHPTGSHRCT